MWIIRALLILASLAAWQLPTGAQEKKPVNPVNSHRDWVDILEKMSEVCSNGTVEEVFDDKLLLLSYGSDQGAKKGERLEIYRLKPVAQYVGKAEITTVGSRYALARLSGHPWVAPKAEDRVVGDFKPLPPLPTFRAFPEFPELPDQRFGGAIIIEKEKPKKKTGKNP